MQVLSKLSDEFEFSLNKIVATDIALSPEVWFCHRSLSVPPAAGTGQKAIERDDSIDLHIGRWFGHCYGARSGATDMSQSSQLSSVNMGFWRFVTEMPRFFFGARTLECASFCGYHNMELSNGSILHHSDAVYFFYCGISDIFPKFCFLCFWFCLPRFISVHTASCFLIVPSPPIPQRNGDIRFFEVPR